MYRYDAIDQRIVDQRVVQFGDQTRRFLAGALSEDEFRPLRLQNGLYIQRHAPMLRIAVPYGLLASRQLRKLAQVARSYDRGYGHFSTRHNLQLNWPKLEEVPAILAELATVQMHAIQTSGNCIRNISTDHFAGIAPDEIVNPLVWCEVLRQWAAFHPEFAYLPRKFKIAVSGSAADRAAVRIHDIGLQAVRADDGAVGFRVLVGGGLGRTPILGQVIRDFLPWPHLLTYLEAILRVYNRYGRRDNIWKARIKILVKERGIEAFRAEVEEDWAWSKDGPATLTEQEIERIAGRFTTPAYRDLPARSPELEAQLGASRAYAAWRPTCCILGTRDDYAAKPLQSPYRPAACMSKRWWSCAPAFAAVMHSPLQNDPHLWAQMHRPKRVHPSPSAIADCPVKQGQLHHS